MDGDFDLVRSLAEPLNAAVGATRVACDEGWIERSAQIGQTGETVSPRLYIGLGVSGAVHHTSGIQGAGTVVAICDDSEAPIFEMADFGVVGDVTEVVPPARRGARHAARLNRNRKQTRYAAPIDLGGEDDDRKIEEPAGAWTTKGAASHGRGAVGR